MLAFRGGTITSLAYHPTTHMAVTTSSGGDFKLWVRQKHRKGSAAHWRCQCVGNYKGEPYCKLVVQVVLAATCMLPLFIDAGGAAHDIQTK